ELHRLGPRYEDEEFRRTAFGPREAELYDRQRDLLARHRNMWLVTYPRWAVAGLWQSFRRGFPTGVQASRRQWSESGPWLRRWLPLEAVHIQAGVVRDADLFASSSLTGLDRLVVH